MRLALKIRRYRMQEIMIQMKKLMLIWSLMLKFCI